MSEDLFEVIDASPDVEVQEADYVRLLGFPRGYRLEGRSRELADWARDWFAANGRPWIFARLAGGLDVSGRIVRVGGADFTSVRLSAQMGASEAHDAVLVAVTAGPECEAEAARCWQADRPDEYFFLEAYGSAVVEYLVARAAGQICAWADRRKLHVLPHYSPGYPGWPVSDQCRLWEVVAGLGARVASRLSVMDTGMLRPKKSLLAVFGLTRNPDADPIDSRMIPCESCVLPDCDYRRVPFRISARNVLK